MATVMMLVSALSPGVLAARTWHVPGDAPTIQAGIDLASPGDDVLVAPGVYLEHDIVMRPGVWVHSVAGPEVTTVDARSLGRGFICTDLQQQATIEGFTIRNGRAQGTADLDRFGGGVRAVRSAIAIRNCIITGCHASALGGGIYATASDVVIERCRILHCRAEDGAGIYIFLPSTATIVGCEILQNVASGVGGVIAVGCELAIVGCVISGNEGLWWGVGGIACVSSRSVIRDCVITDNYAGCPAMGNGIAIGGLYSSAVIEGCTVANNFGCDEPGILVSGADVRIDRTLIAFNRGEGLSCYDAEVVVHCSDLYGNTGGNDICGTDLGGNFSAAPLFCDSQNGDYTLDAGSPCLPGNHPQGVDCGLIGARGLGCGAPPPTGACCFADGSCVVTEPQGCEEQGGTYLGDGILCAPNPCPPTPATNTTWGRIKASYR